MFEQAPGAGLAVACVETVLKHGGFHVAPSVLFFGDSYLLPRFMQGILMPTIVSKMFESGTDFQRFLYHCLHSILKEGARITCDLFVQKSVISHLADRVPPDSLRSDTAFFTMMGDDRVKLRFFKSYIEAMRKRHPDFGKGCYPYRKL